MLGAFEMAIGILEKNGYEVAVLDKDIRLVTVYRRVDREKVIKAIEICYTPGHNCTECPFFSEDDCNDKLMQDALVLLKAQEPILLENQHKSHGAHHKCK